MDKTSGNYYKAPDSVEAIGWLDVGGSGKGEVFDDLFPSRRSGELAQLAADYADDADSPSVRPAVSFSVFGGSISPVPPDLTTEHTERTRKRTEEESASSV